MKEYQRFKFLQQDFFDAIKKYTGMSNIFITEIRMRDFVTSIKYYDVTEWGIKHHAISLLNTEMFK